MVGRKQANFKNSLGARITASPQTSEPKEKPFTRNGFYAARRGDTAKTIADAFDISIDDLKRFNPRLDINKINVSFTVHVKMITILKKNSPQRARSPNFS